MSKKQSELKKETIKSYSLLKEMYEDAYFSAFLVDKGKKILIDLCFQIEEQQPKTLKELYVLTHLATDRFNDLEEEFNNNESEIETVARDCIGMDFAYIAKAYGFDADTEELIATRNW
jgi:predicted transcriptional regulator